MNKHFPALPRRLIIGLVSAAALAAALFGALFFLSRRTADRDAYYLTLSQGQSLMYLDGVPRPAGWVMADGDPYLPLSEAQAFVSGRFYEDEETGDVLLALADSLLVFADEEYGYERNGVRTELPAAPLRRLEGERFVSLDILARLCGLEFSVTDDPAALILRTDGSVCTVREAKAGAILRTAASRFAPVLTRFAGTAGVALSGLDDGTSAWLPVLTGNGDYGYLRRADLAEAEGDVVTVSCPPTLAAEFTHRLVPAHPNVLFHYVDNPARGEQKLTDSLA